MEHAVVILSAEERATLDAWARGRNTAQALAERARVVLACAAGRSDSAIARDLGLSRPTVSRWRRRFLTYRIGGLRDLPRPGAPRRITDADVQRVVDLMLSSPPARGARWSTRSMATACGLSQSAVSRIWRAVALRPGGGDALNVANNATFRESVEDIVGVFVDPPDQLLALAARSARSSQRLSTIRPNQLEIETTTSVRHRTMTLLGALDVSDIVHDERRASHRSDALVRFLEDLDARIPALDLHLIVGDRATCRTPSIQRWLAHEDRYHAHVVRDRRSWLDVVGCWLAFITARQLRGGMACTSLSLIEAIQQHLDSGGPGTTTALIWTKAPAKRIELSRPAPSVNGFQTHDVAKTAEDGCMKSIARVNLPAL